MTHAGGGVVFSAKPNHAFKIQPWAPAPAECRCEACAPISLGNLWTRVGPVSLGTCRLAAIGNTYQSVIRDGAEQSRVSAKDFVAGP